MLRHILLVALAATAAAACAPVDSATSSASGSGSGSGGASCNSDPDETFTAFASSFADYHSWKSFSLPHQADGVHDVNAPLTAYLNKLPPKCATAFPVGTIIVKEVDQGAAEMRQVFAAVKVGGDFNADGAVNWRWFELNRLPPPGDTVRIVWSGAVAPAGEPYLANGKGDCNGCHLGAKDNDYIWSTQLNLKVLAGE